MENMDRISGGFFLIVLMIFTLNPLNNDIQALASAAGSAEVIRVIAQVFPTLYVGLIFTIAAFTGYDIFSQMT